MKLSFRVIDCKKCKNKKPCSKMLGSIKYCDDCREKHRIVQEKNSERKKIKIQ